MIGGGARRAGTGGGRRSRSAPAPKRPQTLPDAGAFDDEIQEQDTHGGRGDMDDEMMDDQMSDDEAGFGADDGVDDDGDQHPEEGKLAAVMRPS